MLLDVQSGDFVPAWLEQLQKISSVAEFFDEWAYFCDDLLESRLKTKYTWRKPGGQWGAGEVLSRSDILRAAFLVQSILPRIVPNKIWGANVVP